jgi:hypothetical protein
MYFGMKNTLKNNHNYTAKEAVHFAGILDHIQFGIFFLPGVSLIFHVNRIWYLIHLGPLSGMST